ncbi:uncharacterized protein LOC133189821 [Saccostrea echinata]|uniref:uncharacterized protein LOC133189821 n=1 Tax=Saccostrea echinata TaxID=191078 RepID=UPI002A8088C2|nr:uncharacterized protein LOC133189821 [Saccostrea echinata]
MNFRLCLVLLLELFMLVKQHHAQDSEEYYVSYNNEGLPSPILKKAINNLVMIHPKNCPGAFRKRNSDISLLRQDPVAASLAIRETNNDGFGWSLSGLLGALHRLHQNPFSYNDDAI